MALVLLLAAACSSEPKSVAAADAARGRLLYETACAGCHSEQVHWRDKRLVRDWPSLVHQVTRWQQIAAPQWRPEEAEDVAAYLNARFYHLP
jgi:cytochrome c